MDINFILLRFGELTLKGKNRVSFENRVISHIRHVLKPFPDLKLLKAYARLYIELNGHPYEAVREQLRKVFGLHSFSPVVRTEPDVESIRKTGLALVEAMTTKLPAATTFKVETRRTDKSFPHDTLAMNRLVGGYILSRLSGLKVDVHRPDIELLVEIRNEGIFMFCETVQGAGGYPVGSNGKGMLMLSGGIDSPVAGYLSMRRGLRIECVHFHSFPYTSERARQKVLDLAAKLAEHTGKIHVHLVGFTDIQTKLVQQAKQNLWITLMRRAMLRITEQLAYRHEALAIVTGDSLGQVASQTLPSMNAIGRAAELPILRPLIMMDKQEIIDMAVRIGTFPISILPYEDCCTVFVPKSPSTNPNLRVVEREESQLTWLDEAIAEAVERTETVIVTGEPDHKWAAFF